MSPDDSHLPDAVSDRFRSANALPSTTSEGLTADPMYREAMKGAWLGLVVNLALGIVKLSAGVVSGSFALISDAVNSLGDSINSCVTLGALWYAQRPADDDHPYGHSRAETVAGAYVALLVIISAILVGWEAVRRMSIVHGEPPAWTLVLAAINVVLKEALYRYKRGISQRTGSTAILANAWDHRSDALCSLAVLIGLAVVRFAGPGWIWADEAAALVVVTLITLTGLRLLWETTSELLDPQANPEMIDRVREIAAAVSGVRDVEKLLVRKTGIEYLVDIHIQVDSHLTVAEGHRIGHLVKDRLVHEIAPIRDVLVHLEPYPHVHGAQS